MQRLEQQAPLRALFPATERGEAPEAVIVNTGGGVVSGDRYDLDVSVEPGAALTVTTTAAEKIYSSAGDDAQIVTRLRCCENASLDWLPQETIFFDSAQLSRRLEVSLEASSRFLGVETVFFGRRASGERLTRGYLRDAWMLRVGGRPVWADAIGLSGDLTAARAKPFGLRDAAGYATIVVAGADAGAMLEAARDVVIMSNVDGGATLVNGVLILRLIDNDSARLRRGVVEAIKVLRPRATGGPGGAPRLWQS